MTQAVPPALAPSPQFTPEYWEQVPREMHKVKIARLTNVDDDTIEFVFDNDQAFKRKRSEIDTDIKLHVNQTVFVQTLRNVIVTGLFVPEVGWVFQMSAQDLAEYAKRLSAADHRQRMEAREQLVNFMAMAIRDAIFEQLGTEEAVAGLDWAAVASSVMESMAQAEPPGSANA